MLSAHDPITWQPRRIAIAGVSGSGKTTLATSLSHRLGLPYVELDGLFHGPNWSPPRDEFITDVQRIIAADAWIIEWQYATVRDQIVERADTMLWLDLPTPRTLYQLTLRTVRRRLRREQLWNGNYEGRCTSSSATPPTTSCAGGIRTRNKSRDRLPAVDA